MTFTEFQVVSVTGQETISARSYPGTHASSLAIVAHPYGPLGGSQDDHVVIDVARTLQKLSVAAYTFNFNRPTSWTGRKECSDYLSIVEHAMTQHQRIDTVYCCGYSYGSLCLPTEEEIKKDSGFGGRIKYIVISPLLPPLSTLLTMGSRDMYSHIRIGEHLAIWGDKDNFTSSSRLRRAWPTGLVVPNTNHFWNSQTSMNTLKDEIKKFIQTG